MGGLERPWRHRRILRIQPIWVEGVNRIYQAQTKERLPQTICEVPRKHRVMREFLRIRLPPGHSGRRGGAVSILGRERFQGSDGHAIATVAGSRVEVVSTGRGVLDVRD